MARARTTVDVDGRRLGLSSLDKVMYPATGTTKGDVVRYVAEMAEHIARHAGGRPATRKRWPDGVGTDQTPGQSFFSKNLESSAPDWVPRRDLQHSDHINTYPLPDDRPTLVWFAQMGTLEIHVPQWRFGRGESERLNPDRLVLDLDPGDGVGLAECVEVAHLVRPILDGMGLVSVPVTSGSKGIHIYAGLDGSASSDDVSAVAQELARTLEREHPDLVVSQQRKTLRAGKVLVDWSQNSANKTTVAPYSLRGRTRPTVAVPRTWDEIDDPDLGQLELAEVLERMARTEDPLAVLTPRADGPGTGGGGGGVGGGGGGPADRLATYRRMRDSDRTPEPVPESAPTPTDGSSFVIHEHHARRFHHDLRLEQDGVLVSWAVPKGVPAGAARDRLAVQTEDHPLEYGSFEGTIPKGSYGAGTVTIWDSGTYENESWKPDKVTFILHGSDDGGLGGQARRFALIRTRSGGDERNWLLHVTKNQPGEDAEPARRAGREAAPADGPLPSPMLAVLGTAADVRGEDWVAEPKWDGIRAVAAVGAGRTRMVSRNGHDLVAMFPDVVAALADGIRGEAVVDGEIVALDSRSRPSFSRLQQRLGLEREQDVAAAAAKVPVHLFLFDVLEVDGEPVTHRPYEERRELLAGLVKDSGRGHLQVPPDLGDDVAGALAISAELGLEGVVAKRLGSPYRSGRRSPDWTKLKHERAQEVVVIGWRHGNGVLSRSFGSLLLAVPSDTGMRYVGRVGTGFDDRQRRRIRAELDDAVVEHPPAEVPALDARDATWVEPVRVGEVAYGGWTDGGRLRHPVWRGWRPDRTPADISVDDGADRPADADATTGLRGGTSGTPAVRRRRTKRGRPDPKDGDDMPKSKAPGLKNPEMYEELRDEGASKEKAARISNAAAKEGKSEIGRRGGEAGSYEDWTVDDLRGRAKELGLSGYSDKKKAELIDMLRNH